VNPGSDVIIVGAGITGASIAFHLAERGLRPLVIEREHAASGATGKSSGLVRMHYDLEAESRLAWTSLGYFRNWHERVGGECGFTRTGFLQIVGPDHNEALRANVAMHQTIGIPTAVVTAPEVKALAPSLAVDDFELAAYEPESGYADPAATTASLLAAARSLGGQFIQASSVTGIRSHAGRVIGVQTDAGELDAPIVVDAAGPWAGGVAHMAGVELPLGTWTHDVLLIRRPPSLGSHPVVIDDVLTMYFRMETGGLTLVALEDGNRFDESPLAPLEHVAPDFVSRAVERICRRMPGMEAGSMQSSYCGRDGFTPDQRPILGQAGPEGFYLACGFSGTGFKLGPAVGACMAELILEGRSKTVDISIFSPKRFAEGKLIQAEHPYGPIWKS
jgi:sarcosine oxidase subunit beta